MVTHPHTNHGQSCLTSVMKLAHKAGLPPKPNSCYKEWKEGKRPYPSTVANGVSMHCKNYHSGCVGDSRAAMKTGNGHNKVVWHCGQWCDNELQNCHSGCVGRMRN